MTNAHADFIRSHTAVVRPQLLPEIALHLATDATALWQVSESWLATRGLPPPFWAFAWAGGQALARHVIDRPEIVADRRVLDLATGSGLVAIAAALAGARSVRAVDVDAVAIASVHLNAALNGVHVEATVDDILDDAIDDVDVVLAGDVFYDAAMTARVLPWLRAIAARGVDVVVGDPFRTYAPRGGLEILAQIDVIGVADVEDGATKAARVLRIVAPIVGTAGTSEAR